MRSLRSLLDPRQVGYLILFVTNRCNFRCNFCFYASEIARGAKPDELTVDEIARLAPRIGPLVQLSLTGGEPFLRTDLFPIADELLRASTPRFVSIPTNGWFTDRTVAFFEELLPRHPRSHVRVLFSVEAIAAAHDVARAMPGSFGRLIDTYRALLPLRRRFGNLSLDTNTVVTVENQHTVLHTIEHLRAHYDFDFHGIGLARGTIPEPSLKRVSEHAYAQVTEALAHMPVRRERRVGNAVFRALLQTSWRNIRRTAFHDERVAPCVAGRKLVVISETGEVFPCEILDRSMGNLRTFDFDLQRLLAQSENDRLRKWIRDSRCHCSFECAQMANLVWNPSQAPRVALQAIKNLS